MTMHNERPTRTIMYAIDALRSTFEVNQYADIVDACTIWKNTDDPVYAQIQLDLIAHNINYGLIERKLIN